MTGLEALILGIIEGATEFLPISSTGHLILASYALQIPQTEFFKTFEIAIQLGAIAAVVVLYFRSFFSLAVLTKLAVAFLPTAIIGFALYPFIKTYLLGNELVVLAALFLGGIVLILFERTGLGSEDGLPQARRRRGVSEVFEHENERIRPQEPSPVPTGFLTYREAALVGLAQAVAIIPGVSRSAATIVGGLALGIPRTVIVEFSFLLAVPTMLAATALDILSTPPLGAADLQSLAIGFITAFVIAGISIRWLLSYVRTHSFTAFGVYRVLIALLFFIFLI